MENVKGSRDYSGEEARKRQKIKGIIATIFKKYGFEVAETPIIEFEEFVRGENPEDEVISDIFRLEDKGKRNLALRYEFTFQLKRIMQNKKLPYRRYQIGEVFRDEPTSMNRFRQFTQCDADIIGSTIKDEAEILAMAKRVLDRLGIKAEIYVNNRKLLDEIMEKEGIKSKDAVIREIDKIGKIGENEIRGNLKKYNAEKLLGILKKPASFFKKYPAYGEIKELEKECRNYGIKINFQPTLARGLSYYNGSVFEIRTKEIKETIIAGGSFLVNSIQSTGISFGLNRIDALAKIKAEEDRILIISINQNKEAVKLAENLRKNDINCIVLYGKPSKSLEYANSYSIPYVIFVGKEEIKKKKFKLRDMKTGREKMLGEKEIIKELKKPGKI